MNQDPLWKYVLIVVLIVIGMIYALPNIYPEDPVLQISHSVNEVVDDDTRLEIQGILEGRGIDLKAFEFDGTRVQLRFHNTEDQLQAADILRSAMSRISVGLNLAPATPGWLDAIRARPMSLGLDLRGGVYFLLEVDTQVVGETAAERYSGEFRTVLRDQNVPYLTVERDASQVVVRLETEEALDRTLSLLRAEYGNELDFVSRPVGDIFQLVATLSREQLETQRRLAVQQNVSTLRNRVDELGVAEPVIQQQGDSRIVVQLPGLQDTARAKEILGSTATLEFRLVDEANDPFEAQASGRVPANSRLYFERDGSPVLLQRRVMLTGDYINDATSGIAQDTGGPAVFINLDAPGARMFSRATGEAIGRLMGTVFIETITETVEIDGEMVRQVKRTEEVINVARIQDQLGRRFQITGLDNSREARNLALFLRAGALAAPMSIVEERTVGPSLGRDNIERGLMSVVMGFVVVMLFMALYYRVFGLVANVALALNLVFLVALLSMLQATLTLPGIAGIVLTVGMAVDANVLIYERIREELRNGNSPQAAIKAGYANALSTIVDSNLTTLIAALALFLFGTGPIKGFAITLSLGILVSMFTALVVTRAIINLIYGRRRRLQKIYI